MRAYAEGGGLTEPASNNVVDLLHDAYRAGLTLPDMAPLPGVTIYLSERYGLYTSTEPQNPGTFREYQKARRLERTLDAIADATEERFRDVKEFADSFADGTFPLALARSFDAIYAIHGENVHLRNPRIVDGRQDGDIFIEKTVFTVEPGTTWLLNTVFSKLLHKNIPKNKAQRQRVHQPMVYADEGGDGRPPTITLTNVSEHDIRAAGRAVDVLLLRRFRGQGVRLPGVKTSLSEWLDWGNTFPHRDDEGEAAEALHFMRGVAAKYYETTATATYHSDYAAYGLVPVSHIRGPLGTDASGIFQRWRNIINGLGHHLREGTSAYNLEQHPDRLDRISLEQGRELRREAVTPGQAGEYGPGAARTLTSVELAAEALWRRVDEMRGDKFGAAAKAARAAASLGFVDLGLAVVAKAPTGLKVARELSGDAAAYRAGQRAVKARAEVLKHVVWHEVMGPRFRELDAA